MQELYGVSNVLQIKAIKRKAEQTCLSRYGARNVSQSKKIQEKKKQNCLKKYGVDSVFKREDVRKKIKETVKKRYGVENVAQSASVQKKSQETCLQKYGVPFSSQSENNKQKRRKTNLEKRGVECNFQTEENKQKVKQTCLNRYGVENPMQCPSIKSRVKNTYFERTGYEYPGQNPDVKSSRYTRYTYDALAFDSKPELAFYMYWKDQGKNIKRESKQFTFMVNGRQHYYTPDFEIDEQFYEIKGSQFLAENGQWQCSYNHELDAWYERVHQVALKNNVKILYPKDYNFFMRYVYTKYGDTFFESCRRTKE